MGFIRNRKAHGLKSPYAHYAGENTVIKEVKIALVEDTESDALACEGLLNEYAKSKDYVFDITCFHNGETFLTNFKSQYDFIILDVELGDRNGIDIARVIRESDEDVIIMFQTNLGKYATSGYEVSAIDYVLKPLNYPSLSLKLDRVMKRLNSKSEESILVKMENGFSKISLDNILYIEVYAHDVLFHEVDKVTKTYGTLKKFEEELHPKYFYRCNSCYLVNAEKIMEIKGFDVILTNGETLKISHPRRKDFIAEFKTFIMEKGG